MRPRSYLRWALAVSLTLAAFHVALLLWELANHHPAWAIADGGLCCAWLVLAAFVDAAMDRELP